MSKILQTENAEKGAFQAETLTWIKDGKWESLGVLGRRDRLLFRNTDAWEISEKWLEK